MHKHESCRIFRLFYKSLFYTLLDFLLFVASCQLFGGQLITDNYLKTNAKSGGLSLLKAIEKIRDDSYL
jgi:hypothetical protein